MKNKLLITILGLLFSITIVAQEDADVANKDQVIPDDLIVDGSLGVGFDATNGMSFGFSTIILKENNTRLKFWDTSTSSSFPKNIWELVANDSQNGGANHFSFDDVTHGTTPFRVMAGAPSYSLFVSSAGRLGLGTQTPVVELHVSDGDSPTLRLEQDGSSGWSPQTWDVAGNETNFFVRDVTNGSKLPFRIKPGAPTNSLFINSDGKVGLGTQTPDGVFDVAHPDNANNHALIVAPNSYVGINIANGNLPAGVFDVVPGDDPNVHALLVAPNGKVGFGTETPEWDIEAAGDGLKILQVTSNDGNPVQYRIKSNSNNRRFLAVDNSNAIQSQIYFKGLNQMEFLGANASTSLLYLDNGNVGIGTTTPQSKLAVNGTITAKEVEVTLVGWPDYVFAEDYKLRPLSEVETFINENKHLPGVPNEQEVLEDGVNLGEMNAILLEKIEELTLYMIDLKKENEKIKSQLEELKK